MSGVTPIASQRCEFIEGGPPTFPPVITVEMFGREFPLMHGATVLVQPVEEFDGIILALGHPQMEAGLFLGVSPDLARNIAAWLLNAANMDGGKGKQ